MIVFTWTRQDRIAEIGGGVSFLLWLALNGSRLRTKPLAADERR
jgi:hypothetical protein